MAHERGRPNGNGNGSASSFGGLTGASNAGEQIRDIVHVLFKRKRLIGTLFLAVCLPGLLITAMQKPSWLATAKVMISKERNDPTLQPTDLTKVDPIQLNEALVNSEVQVLGSRDLMARVVRVLAMASDGNRPPHLEGKVTPFGSQVLSLAQNLTITPIKA